MSEVILSYGIDATSEPCLLVSTSTPEFLQTSRYLMTSKLDLDYPKTSVRYETILRMQETIEKLDSIIVPVSMSKVHAYFDTESREKWKEQQPFLSSLLPEWHGKVFVLERVPYFSIPIRIELINLHYPITMITNVLGGEGNHARTRHILSRFFRDFKSLSRPYLGKRRTFYPCLQFGDIVLGSFPLYIDQMEMIGLDVELYSSMMAETLAIFYWVCGWDARGIQFILAPTKDNSKSIESGTLGMHTIWVDHMDECRTIPLTRHGVEQAVWAFLANDPYCPRPGKEDPRDKVNWAVFRQAFIRKSRELLKGEDLWLANYWIEKVEAWGSNDLL